MRVRLGFCTCLECRLPYSPPSSSCRLFKSREKREVCLIPTSSLSSEFSSMSNLSERIAVSIGRHGSRSIAPCRCSSSMGVRGSSVKMGRNNAMGGLGHWALPWLAGTQLPALGLGAFEHRLSDPLAGSSPGAPPLLYQKRRRGGFWRASLP